MSKRPIRILYIAGWQRSGSTILANILGQVDGFISTGELYYLWDYVWSRNTLCGCGLGFHACPMWSEVIRAAFGAPDRIDADGMRRMAQFAGKTRGLARYLIPGIRGWMAKRLRDYVANLGRLYAAIVETTGCDLIVDSSKWPSYGRVLQMIPGVEVKVVHLVRDPRAVAYSWLRRKELPDRDPPEEMYRTPADSSLHWSAWNVASELFWGRDVLRLRYEDFVRQPAASVRRILEFVGEPARRVPFSSDRAIDLRPTHTVSGNPVRLRSGPVELVEDDEWKSRIRHRDHALVTLLTFPLLLKYRYVGWRSRDGKPRPTGDLVPGRLAFSEEIARHSAGCAPKGACDIP